MSSNTLHILVPESGYASTLAFNSFRVENLEWAKLIQCSLVTSSGFSDPFTFLLSNQTLTRNKDSMIQYLGKIGQPKGKFSPLVLPPPLSGMLGTVRLARMIMASTAEGEGEIALSSFSASVAIRNKKFQNQSTPLNADPVANLVCPIEILRHFVVEVFSK